MTTGHNGRVRISEGAAVEVRYSPGEGVLVARGDRWLLVGTSRGGGLTSLLDQLWDDLGQPSARALVLATVTRHLPGTPLAWLDGATGDHLAQGGATATRRGDRWELALPGDRGTPPTFRLVAGVAAAGAVHVTGAVPVAGGVPAPEGVVIAGVPPEILAAGRTTPPPSYDAAPAVPEAEPGSGTVRRHPAAHRETDTDHDHHTVLRPAGTAAPTGGHLEQTTSDTVLAVRCDRGHLTDPLGPVCRACGGPVPRQEPQRVIRPQLGVLRLAGGELVALDRPVVLGRQPSPAGPGDWPHLVGLPPDSTYLSRSHLRIDLDGWHVLAEDLSSRGGTTVLAPGRDPEMIRAHEPYLLEHGTVVDLAGAYRLTYLSRTEEDA